MENQEISLGEDTLWVPWLCLREHGAFVPYTSWLGANRSAAVDPANFKEHWPPSSDIQGGADEALRSKNRLLGLL